MKGSEPLNTRVPSGKSEPEESESTVGFERAVEVRESTDRSRASRNR